MRHHVLTGSNGTRLHVAEHGPRDGAPILLIHGWSQVELCWEAQYDAQDLAWFRLLGLDLRGHGLSRAPSDPEDFAEADFWADAVAAVIDGLNLEAVTPVG